MWKIYAIGFAVMAAFMLVAGAILFVVTLMHPPVSSATPEWTWLLRAAFAIVLGGFAAGLSTLAWRQSRRSV